MPELWIPDTALHGWQKTKTRIADKIFPRRDVTRAMSNVFHSETRSHGYVYGRKYDLNETLIFNSSFRKKKHARYKRISC